MSTLPRLDLRICGPNNHKTTEEITKYIDAYKTWPNNVYLIGVYSLQLEKIREISHNYMIHMNVEKYFVRDVKKMRGKILEQEYKLNKSYSLTELKEICKQPLTIRVLNDGFEVMKNDSITESMLSEYITNLFLDKYDIDNNFGVGKEGIIYLEYPIEIHMQDEYLHYNTHGEAYRYYATSLSVQFGNTQKNKQRIGAQERFEKYLKKKKRAI